MELLTGFTRKFLLWRIQKWVKKVKSKIKTGLKTNRPALQELFEDIKQRKIDKNYFDLQTDRFARFPKDF